MVAVREHLVPPANQRKSAGVNPVTSITIHETGNTGSGATANAHARLQAGGNSRKASWHETIDDKEAVISYLPQARCWHAASAAGNNTSYSIEICVNSGGNYPQAVRNTAERVAHLLKQFNLPLTAVVQHNHWSGKNCPERLRSGRWGYSWDDFLNLVRGYLQETLPKPVVDVAVTPPAPVVTSNPSVVAYQKRQNTYGHAGLHVDGINGPKTQAWRSWVLDLQDALNQYHGGDLVLDGDYGSVTHARVAEVQRRNGLVVDGIAGPVTIGWMRRQGTTISDRP